MSNNHPIILRNGTILTAAAKGEVLTATDILIENGVIAAIGKGLERDGAEIIDVTGRIVMPGFVDTHRHT